MRLKIILATLMSSLMLMFGVFGHTALAVNVLLPCDNPQAKDSSVCKDAQQTDLNKNPIFGPQGLVTKFIQILAIIIAVGSVVMILIGAFRFITSAGNPQSIDAARKTIIYALVGLMVAVVAQTIVSFVLGKLPA